MVADSTRKPRLAYLTTVYPSVSHTFIRREILGLEALGYDVLRLAIRPGGDVVDPADREEAEKTSYCLGEPLPRILLRAGSVLLRRPLQAMRALRMTYAMHRRSERGLFRHLAYLAEAAVLLHKMDRHRIDHVHVHFGTNAAAVARLSRCLGGPSYSMTVHGPDEFDAAIGLSLGEKMTDAAFTVAITDYCASQLRRWVPYPEWPKIHVVHCTVGDNWFDSARPIPEDSETLVCVGRLSAQKGQLLLLDAFADALSDRHKGRLVLVGDGEMRGVVQERIDGLGLAEHVTITGWQSEAEVREHLLTARALVLGSFAEGLPVVLMEAMALQRPVIATYIAGIPELVRPVEHGWLAIAGNRAQLAAAIQQALSSPIDKLNKMGRAAAKTVRERHSTIKEVARLEGLFRDYADYG